MTMREKVARIMIAGMTPKLWDAISPETKHFWLERADLVFDALMEPTTQMQNYVREFQNDHEIRNKEIMQIWKPMIRAAKEGK